MHKHLLYDYLIINWLMFMAIKQEIWRSFSIVIKPGHYQISLITPSFYIVNFDIGK